MAALGPIGKMTIIDPIEGTKTLTYSFTLAQELWVDSPGENFFKFMDWFEHLVVAKGVQSKRSKDIADEIYSSLKKAAAEGVVLNKQVLSCINSYSNYWVVERRVPDSVPVPGSVYISLKKRELSLSQFGVFPITEEKHLKQLSSGWFNISSAMLCREKNEVKAILKIKRRMRTLKPQGRRTNSKQVRTASNDSKTISGMQWLESCISSFLQNELALSKALSQSSSWDSLSGYSVSGGLPSLGKNAK